EGAAAILGEDEIALRLLQHLHVSAERQKGEAVLGLAPAESKNLGTKTKTEGDDPHSECLGKQKVSHLVHEDQRADQYGEIEQIHVRQLEGARTQVLIPDGAEPIMLPSGFRTDASSNSGTAHNRGRFRAPSEVLGVYS